MIGLKRGFTAPLYSSVTNEGTSTRPPRFEDTVLAWRFKMSNLLYWAVVFLIVAIVAALFGFGGVAGTATSAASLLFWVAIILFVVSLVAGLIRRG
jgi:uncharacterized membrane protein YtjA (UPF0391 family)